MNSSGFPFLGQDPTQKGNLLRDEILTSMGFECNSRKQQGMKRPASSTDRMQRPRV